jgi:hypothetical protein
MNGVRALGARAVLTRLTGGSCPLASLLVAKRVGDKHDRHTHDVG